MMKPTLTCCLFVLLIAAYAAAEAADQASRPPNIVLLIADDLGWSDLSCMGSDFYETPHIDALAAEGMLFTHAYAASANCAPSRAALMSGRYAPHTGVYTVGTPNRGKAANRKLLVPENTAQLAPDFVTIAERLQDGGYATGHFGKWHLGEGETGPIEQGFDVNFGGGQAGHPKSFFSPYKNEQIEDGPDGEHLTERMGREGARFIAAHTDEPFFLYMPFYAVHTPIQPPADHAGRFAAKPPGTIHDNARYAALIAAMDDAVGVILNALDAAELRDNTIVIFTSDNGGFGRVTSNAPLRGSKGMFYEGGIRVPLVVRWPSEINGGSRSDQPVSGIDLYPTLLEVSNLKENPDAQLDGMSLVPALRGLDLTSERALFWHFPAYLEAAGAVKGLWRTTPCSVIRRGDYKLQEFFEDGRVELYNLIDDPGETTDLSTSMPKLCDELHTALIAWRVQTKAAMPTGSNPAYTPPVVDD